LKPLKTSYIGDGFRYSGTSVYILASSQPLVNKSLNYSSHSAHIINIKRYSNMQMSVTSKTKIQRLIFYCDWNHHRT